MCKSRASRRERGRGEAREVEGEEEATGPGSERAQGVFQSLGGHSEHSRVRVVGESKVALASRRGSTSSSSLSLHIRAGAAGTWLASMLQVSQYTHTRSDAVAPRRSPVPFSHRLRLFNPPTARPTSSSSFSPLQRKRQQHAPGECERKCDCGWKAESVRVRRDSMDGKWHARLTRATRAPANVTTAVSAGPQRKRNGTRTFGVVRQT